MGAGEHTASPAPAPATDGHQLAAADGAPTTPIAPAPSQQQSTGRGADAPAIAGVSPFAAVAQVPAHAGQLYRQSESSSTLQDCTPQPTPKPIWKRKAPAMGVDCPLSRRVNGLLALSTVCCELLHTWHAFCCSQKPVFAPEVHVTASLSAVTLFLSNKTSQLCRQSKV